MTNLVVGVAISCLVANVARTAVRRGAARTFGQVPGSPAGTTALEASDVGKDGEIGWPPRSTPADIDVPSN